MNHNEKIVRSLKFVVDKYLDDKVKDSKLSISASKIKDVTSSHSIISRIVNIHSMEYLNQVLALFLVYEGETISSAVDIVFNKGGVSKLFFETADDLITTEDCEYCGGGGEIYCENCGGDGEFQCDFCDGLGYDDCSHCEGIGSEECVECVGSGVDADDEPCHQCDGEGNVKCYECEGESTLTCGECNGDTTLECQDCYGNGQIDCADCDSVGYQDLEPNEYQIEVETNGFLVLSSRFSDFISRIYDIDDEDEANKEFSKEIMDMLSNNSESILPLSRSTDNEDVDMWSDEEVNSLSEIEVKHKLLSYSSLV